MEQTNNNSKLSVFLFTKKDCNPCNAFKVDLKEHKEDVDKLRADIYNIDMSNGLDLSEEHLNLMTTFNVQFPPTTVIKYGEQVFFNGMNIKTFEQLEKKVNQAIKYFNL